MPITIAETRRLNVLKNQIPRDLSHVLSILPFDQFEEVVEYFDSNPNAAEDMIEFMNLVRKV